MTTSSTYNFNLTVDSIVEEAAERAKINPQTLSGQALRSAKRSLDLLLLQLSAKNVPIWCLDQIDLPLIVGQATYTLASPTRDILQGAIRQNGVDIPIRRLDQADYLNIPNKTASGRPVQYFTQLTTTTPTVTFWPVPDIAGYSFFHWRIRKIQDVGAATNTLDIPPIFLPAIVEGLAIEMLRKKPFDAATTPLDMQLIESIKPNYDYLLDIAETEFRERTSFNVFPFYGRI
ncbi:MAG: hypothetical protein EBR82_31100 [Caulobacteraceae bacterium]|nr:hypothetical protein [Caulobacteraceae bacterium]